MQAVGDGFVASPLVPIDVPPALAFGPGSGCGDLYVPVLDGVVRRLHLAWTDAGLAVVDRSVAANGFTQPLGVTLLERGRRTTRASPRTAPRAPGPTR